MVLVFEGAEQTPNEVQVATLKDVLDNLERIGHEVSKVSTIRKSMLVRREHHSIGVKNKVTYAFEELPVLQTFYFPMMNVGRSFGMFFGVKWNREHGFGVKYLDDRIDELGKNEIYWLFE